MTGGGMPSGTGFIGGYGPVPRSGYATPADLGAKPWALAFQGEAGWGSYPLELRVDPVANGLHWRTDDWDPGLRFWTLPFDTHLSEWLQDVDLSAPSVMAAREFARQHERWSATAQAHRLGGAGESAWILRDDLLWRPETHRGGGARAGEDPDKSAWAAIDREIEELADLMRNERRAFLDEAWLQSDNIPLYFLHFLGIDRDSRPWTMELVRCGLAIGNLVYMHYKDHYRRVRPSVVCPGLVPPWGPPRHPSFPSGHSFLGHFIAHLLLDVPGIALRYGVFEPGATRGRKPTPPAREHAAGKSAAAKSASAESAAAKSSARKGTAGERARPADSDFVRDGQPVPYGADMRCPLFWLAWRLARNRERIGVHYPSDSSASRWLARGIHAAIDSGEIRLPTLERVRVRACAEWPDGAA